MMKITERYDSYTGGRSIFVKWKMYLIFKAHLLGLTGTVGQR